MVDNTPGTSAATSPMFAMSGDGTDDVTIPVVFLFYQDASQLLQAVTANPALEVTVADMRSMQQHDGAGGEVIVCSLNIEIAFTVATEHPMASECRLRCTRPVRKVSSHFEYLENQVNGIDVTWQPVGGDLTARLRTVTLPWG